MKCETKNVKLRQQMEEEFKVIKSSDTFDIRVSMVNSTISKSIYPIELEIQGFN